MLVLILAETTSTDSSTNQVKLVVTEANISMCAELHERLQTALGSSSSVVRVGYDVERSVDLFEEWLGEHLEVLLETESKQLKMVDASISYFVQKLAA